MLARHARQDRRPTFNAGLLVLATKDLPVPFNTVPFLGAPNKKLNHNNAKHKTRTFLVPLIGDIWSLIVGT